MFESITQVMIYTFFGPAQGYRRAPSEVFPSLAIVFKTSLLSITARQKSVPLGKF